MSLDRLEAQVIEPPTPQQSDPRMQQLAQRELERRAFERAKLVSKREIDPDTGRNSQPRTIHEWHDWLVYGLGYRFTLGQMIFSWETLNPGEHFEHTVPLVWTFDLYCLANGRSGDGLWTKLTPKEMSKAVKTFLLHSTRSGSKTLGLAIFIFSMMWWVDGWTWTHAAATRDQAFKLLEYMRDNWSISPIFSAFVLTANTKQIKLANGSYCQIVTGSVAGLNSPHTLGISFDELELMTEDVLSQGLMIPQAQAGRGMPSLTIMASTQKTANALMARKVTEAKQGKHRYILWNIWDVIEACEDWRREDLVGVTCTDYPGINTRIEELERLGLHLAPPEKKLLDRLKVQRADLEENCALVADCQGRAIGGNGHYSIDVAIEEWKAPRHVVEAELLCKKPSMRGLVYELYDAEQNESIIVRALKSDPPKVKIIGCADYGFTTDPAAAHLVAVHGPHFDVFHEVHQRGWLSDKQAQQYEDLSRQYGVSYWVVDKSAKELIKCMRARGLKVMPSVGKVNPGIEALAELVCNGRQFRSLRINPVTCPEACLEFATYKLGADGEPLERQQDHHVDALRYLARHLALHRGRQSTIKRRGHDAGQTRGGRVILHQTSHAGRSAILGDPRVRKKA